MNENISNDRKEYLAKKKKQKILVVTTQITILVGFILIWELLAKLNIIDGFLTSQPSRVLNTVMDLSSNDLLMHLGVTCFETIVGFLLGTIFRNYNCLHTLVVSVFLQRFRSLFSNTK